MQNKRITQCAGYQTREREGSERMGGRGSVAKHSHKLQAADQTQANSTAAGKKLSWFSQDLAKNSQLLKKVTISHPEYVCRFLSSFWTLRVLRLEKFHNIEYKTNINHVCLFLYASLVLFTVPSVMVIVCLSFQCCICWFFICLCLDISIVVFD